MPPNVQVPRYRIRAESVPLGETSTELWSSSTRSRGNGTRTLGRVVLVVSSAASVAFFGYRVAGLSGASVSNASPHPRADLIVTVLAGFLGVGYFS
jgi:hypothetical protein